MKKNTRTRQAIIETSTRLFNEYGVEVVSFAHIAEELGISPGNVTYYFRRKSDLVTTLLETYKSELFEVAQSSGFNGFVSSEQFDSKHARELGQILFDIFILTWKYQFLFTTASYILKNDLIQLQVYQSFIDEIVANLKRYFRQLVKLGLMQRVQAPFNVETLIDSIWWQWLGWMGEFPFEKEQSAEHLNTIVANGVTHCLFVVRPYMDDKWVNELFKVFKRLGRQTRG